MAVYSRAAARLSGIYAIVNEGSPDPVQLTRAVLQGGVRIVQYRAKNGIVIEHARAIRELTRACGALFILNDAWREVEQYDADGVHLGPEDVELHQIALVREAIGAKIIGASCGTAEEARVAQHAGADYIGAGPIYETVSKRDAGPAIGIAGLCAVLDATSLPVAAIGGITLGRLPEVRAAAVAMAAVISEIASSPEPGSAAAALVAAWNECS